MPIQFKPVNLDILRRTTRTDFYSRIGVSEQEAIYPVVAMDVDSDSDQEVHAFFGAIPKPVRTDAAAGAGIIKEASALRDFGLTVVNAEWEVDVPIKRHIIEDAKLDMVRVRAETMADSATSFLDERMTAIIESNGNAYDGVAFFAALHHGGTGDAKDNDVGSSAGAPSAPTITEVENAMSDAITRAKIITDDQSRIANTGELGWVWMVPPNMERAFKAIVEVGPVAGQTGNSGVYKGLGTVVSNPFLTNTERFYAFVTSKVIKPLLYQRRIDWEFNFYIGEGDDWNIRNVGHMLSRGRWEFALGDWKKGFRVILT